MGATPMPDSKELQGPMGRRILATDAQERSVLASLRCLGAAGFEVTAVGSTILAPGLWSRTLAGRRLAPDPQRDLDGFLAKIEAMIRERRYEVLLAGTDASLLAISHYRERFTPYVRLGLPPHEIVVRALDRGRLAQAAIRAGLPTPEERICAGSREAAAAAAEFGYPVAVKPIATVVEVGGVARRRASRRVSDPRALECAIRSLGQCIVQRWAPGDVISVGGVATEQELLAHVVSRYIRMWPSSGGNVSFSQTIRPPTDLVERVQELLAALEWTGLFELELIDRRDGHYAAIDFNPRAYGSLSLAGAAGVPLSALWCSWLLGEPPRRRYLARPGVRYRWEDADLRYVAQALHRGRMRSALAAAQPHRGVTHAYFHLDDPAPGLVRPIQATALAIRLARDRAVATRRRPKATAAWCS